MALSWESQDSQVLAAVLQKFSQREEHLIKFLCTFSAALKIPQLLRPPSRAAITN